MPLAPAPVVIVRFMDYQCVACRSADEYFRPLFDELNRRYPGAVRLITYDFPLGAECNPRSGDLHKAACKAAAAMRMARQRNHSSEMENWLWANQRKLTPEGVVEAVRSIAGIDDFDARYASALQEVRRDVEVGHQLGVQGTPTFFLNGVVLAFVPEINMRAAIMHELRTAGIASVGDK